MSNKTVEISIDRIKTCSASAVYQSFVPDDLVKRYVADMVGRHIANKLIEHNKVSIMQINSEGDRQVSCKIDIIVPIMSEKNG